MLAKFIPLREAAQIIGVSPKTLENWLAGGYFARTADGKRSGSHIWTTALLSIVRFNSAGKSEGSCSRISTVTLRAKTDKTKPREPGFFVKEIL